VIAIIPDNLVSDRRRFIDEKHSTSFSLHSHPSSTPSSYFTLIFHSPSPFRIDSHHHREGLKPIDHALDYSGLELARHSRRQSHSLAFVSPPPISLSSQRSSPFGGPQQQSDYFSRTLTNQSHRVRNVAFQRSLMATFLIINFPSLAKKITKRRDISVLRHCRSMLLSTESSQLLYKTLV